MKFCRFEPDRIGVVLGDRVADISDIVAQSVGDPGPGANAFVAALPSLRERLLGYEDRSPTRPFAGIRLLPPIAASGKIIGAPVNYQDHIDEMIGNPIATPHKHREIEKAGLFLMAASSLAGPHDRLRLQFPDRRTDPEVELVVVIGRKGRDIPRSAAIDHVAGYCLGLDVTVRGPEDRSFRKSIDGYSILGPWMVTPDELSDPSAVQLSLSVNGIRRQFASTADLIFDVPRLIQYASSFYTLHPGDLLYTGTPAGVGPIVPGDHIEASGTQLGDLRIEVTA